MFEYIILAFVCFGIGVVTGVWLMMTIITKAMRGVKSIFKPPTQRGP